MPDPRTDVQLDDGIDINLRSVDEVVRRTIVLVTLARRGAIESSALEIDYDADLYAGETDRFELYSWARRKLSAQILPDELQLLRTQVGSLSPEMLDHCSEAMIAAETLCWSLGLIDELPEPSLPAPETVERLFGWAPEPWADVDPVQVGDGLRDELLIAQERERRELWHWRSQLDAGGVSSTEELRSIIRETVQEADDANLVSILEEDFSFLGQPVAKLSADQFAELGDISMVQLTSLNWVCGFGDAWDSVPLFPE